MSATQPLFFLVAALLGLAIAFSPHPHSPNCIANDRVVLRAQDGEWKGDVVSNTEDGRIRGCTIHNVGDSIVDWIIQIDG